MAKNYKGPGSIRTWTNNTGAAVASGDVVVVGQQIGIALGDIADGADGEVAFEGEFTVPKVAGAAINHGEMVMWDASAGAFDDNAATPASGDVSGAAVAAHKPADADTEMVIQLANRIGTVA